ncbi:AAA family ATPase, partial [Acinetobacter baumannii]
MKFKSVELSGVGGIDYLKIDKINPKFNIICGENGVGKTNILEAL